MRQLDPLVGAMAAAMGGGGILLQLATAYLEPAVLLTNLIAGILGIWLLYLRLEVTKEDQRRQRGSDDDD